MKKKNILKGLTIWSKFKYLCHVNILIDLRGVNYWYFRLNPTETYDVIYENGKNNYDVS